MAYGGGKESGKSYVSMMTAFVDAFPGKNIYAVIAPIATEFYLPEKARNVSHPGWARTSLTGHVPPRPGALSTSRATTSPCQPGI